MRVDGPEPGTEINTGEATEPRPAASVIVLRDGDDGPEVLLVQRNPESRFMGGAWVFPGGAVHDDDEGGPEGAALRELQEEAAIELSGPGALESFSRWITPAMVSVRFDTYFYVAALPDGAEPEVDGGECVDLRWITPTKALAAGERDEMSLVFPTIKHLEQLTEFQSVEQALADARERKVMPVEPRVVVDGGVAEVLLPGEPGYDD